MERFQLRNLLTFLGGLQLVPENASRLFRLQALAHLAVAADSKETKQPKPSAIASLVNDIAAPFFTHLEDPPDGLFVQHAPFDDHHYLVISGLFDEASFEYLIVNQALESLRETSGSEHFVAASKTILAVALRLSDLIARRAGIADQTITREVSSILIPPASRFVPLRKAVELSPADLQERLSDLDDWKPAVERLCAQLGTLRLPTPDETDAPLLLSPIIATTNSYIVAAPGGLLNAAILHVLASAEKAHLRPRFAAAIQEQLTAHSRRCLKRLGLQPQPGLRPPDDQLPFSEDIFQARDFELVYLQQLRDDLLGITEAAAGTCDLSKDLAVANARMEYVRDGFERGGFARFALRRLEIIQSIGRPLRGLERYESHDDSIVLSNAELDWIAFEEEQRPGALVEYLRTKKSFEQRTTIHAVRDFDVFAMYHGHDRSFYIADDASMDSIYVSPSSKGDLVRQLQRKRCLTAARIPGIDRALVVESRYQIPGIPIFVPSWTHNPYDGIPHLVAGAKLHVAILPRRPRNGNGRLYEVISSLAQMLSYWLWRVDEVLSETQHPEIPLQIELSCGAEEDWADAVSRPAPSAEAADDLVTISSGVNDLAYHVEFRPDFELASSIPDNRAERFVVRALLDKFVSRGVLRYPSPDEIIVRIASDPLRKVFVNVSTATDLRLDAHAIPDDVTTIPTPYEGEVLDRIGRFAQQDLRLPIGPVQREERTNVLNKIVGFLYRDLTREIRDWHQNAVRTLILYQESYTHARAQHGLMVPTRVACYPEFPEVISSIKRQEQDSSRLNLANRFLLELVAAQPPTGDGKSMSSASYLRALALAVNIIEMGQLSDAINYEIAQIDIVMLPSGRLGHDDLPYREALSAYRDAYTSELVDDLMSGYASRVAPGNVTRKPRDVPKWDSALLGEFGYTLSTLAEVYASAIFMVQQDDAPGGDFARSEFEQALIEDTKCPEAEVRSAVDALTLGPRHDYLAPPSGFEREDIWPWIFNRRLSYLRRPIILNIVDGVERVRFGKRHMFESLYYFWGLCTSARLRCNSPELKKQLSVVAARQNTRFNDYVADVAGSLDAAVLLRKQVKKVGKLRIQRRGFDLGDIDVLVADSALGHLVLVECKDLGRARNPRELHNELGLLFKDVGRKKSTATKHTARVRWVEENLNACITEFGLDADITWSVRGLIVTSRELVSPYLQVSPFPVVSIAKFKMKWNDQEFRSALWEHD